jgi:hypothetical protein
VSNNLNQRSFLNSFLILFTYSIVSAGQPVIPKTHDASPAVQAQVTQNLSAMPLYFIENQGQMDSSIRYYSRGHGGSVFFTKDGIITQYVQYNRNTTSLNKLNHINPKDKYSRDTTPLHVKGVNIHTKLVGSNKNPSITSLQELPGKMNYFIGNDSTKWHTNVPIFQQVQYQNVYPGINLLYKGTSGKMEYDFVVSSGAKPEDIQLEIQGADKLEITSDGDLAIHTPLGTCIQKKPKTYQENTIGLQSDIPAGFILSSNNRIAFHVPFYDKTKPLTIDPLIYSTYLGGSDYDQGNSIAVDASGNAYVTGYILSSNFPTTAGAFDTTFNGGNDVFVTKLNPSGSGLVYSTFLGGTDDGGGNSIAVDASGNAYVTGSSNSPDFPTTLGAFDTSYNGSLDIFVTKLNSSGSELIYSTLLGGTYNDSGQSIAVDTNGNTYVTGWTESYNFPTFSERLYAPIPYVIAEAFVTKLNPSGSALVYSKIIGTGTGSSIAVDASGNAYVTGWAESSIPITAGAFDSTWNGGNDVFVSKLNASGSGYVYSTYLGGSGYDWGNSIAIDSSGNAYVTGYTYSSDFPTTPGAFDTSFNGGFWGDVFVTKINASGTGLIYSTYLGDSGYDHGNSIAVDIHGNAYVTGYTTSPAFPTTSGAFDTTFNGGPYYGDAFVTKMNISGSGLEYSTFLGGSDEDEGVSIAIDTSGNAYVTGWTVSTADFPITAGAFDMYYYGGDEDTFVTKINLSPELVTSFYGNPISGIAPLTVQFHDSSAIYPTIWNWSFGDGGTSIEQNPTHSYLSSGRYTVTLSVSGNNGSNSWSITNYINVLPKPTSTELWKDPESFYPISFHYSKEGHWF